MFKTMLHNALGWLLMTLGIIEERDGGHHKIQTYNGPSSPYYRYVWRLCSGFGLTRNISFDRVAAHHNAGGTVHHTIKQP